MTDRKAKIQVAPGTSLEYRILLYVGSEFHRSPQLCAEYTPVHQFRTRPDCENSDKIFLTEVGVQSFHQRASNLPLLSKQKAVLLAHEIHSFKHLPKKNQTFSVSLIFPLSMDWIKGKFTGKPHIQWENLWFPVNFPFNQSIDFRICRFARPLGEQSPEVSCSTEASTLMPWAGKAWQRCM